MKSAHHLAKELDDRKASERSRQVKESPVWKMIWTLPIQKWSKKKFLENLS
jgi:hypothetical protein